MKKQNYTRLYLLFYTDKGEAAVTYLDPVPGLTKKSLKPITDRLIETYRTKKGVRLKEFKRAFLRHHIEDPLQ